MTQPTHYSQPGDPSYSTAAEPRESVGGSHADEDIRLGSVEPDFESALTDDMRLALHDVQEAARTCEWCADRCLDHGVEMADCVRRCRDTASLAALSVAFIARDSPFGLEVAEAFARAATECADECASHPHAHCQECARVLDRAVRSTWRLVGSIEREQDARTVQ